jgi:hypothetical protein
MDTSEVKKTFKTLELFAKRSQRSQRKEKRLSRRAENKGISIKQQSNLASKIETP